MSYQVTVHVYDLSMGMARTMSQALIGQQIDGIWHTAVIAYGREYFYGGGIWADVPGATPYGTPVERIDMGMTAKSQVEFEQWLRSVSPRFTMEAYHLLNHNCNNFTDEACKYLVEQPIPAHITGLPATVMSTPLGRMLEPMINNVMQAKNGMAGMIPTEDMEFAQQPQDFLDHADVFPSLTEIKFGHELNGRSALVYYWDSSLPESVDMAFVHSEVLASVKEEAKEDVLLGVDLRKVSGVSRPEVVPCVRVQLGGKQVTTIVELTREELVPHLSKLSYKFSTLRLSVTDPILYTKGTLVAPRNYITNNLAAITEKLPPETATAITTWTTSHNITNIPAFMNHVLIAAAAVDDDKKFAFIDVLKTLANQDQPNRYIFEHWSSFEPVVTFFDDKSAKLSFQLLANLFSSPGTRQNIANHHTQILNWVKSGIETNEPKCIESAGHILYNLTGLALSTIDADDCFIELLSTLIMLLADLTDMEAVFAVCNGLAPVLIANEELKGLATALDLPSILERLRDLGTEEKVKGIAADLLIILA